MRSLRIILSLLVSLSSICVNASTVDDVLQRDTLRCGVSEGTPGFSKEDDSGTWHGLDVDICRAVAAAVLEDPQKVDFIPMKSKFKISTLTEGKVDLTSRTSTWTMKRDTAEKVDFTAIVYFDGQGFMVPKKRRMQYVSKGLRGSSVCVTEGTTSELNLADYNQNKKLGMKIKVFADKKSTFAQYAAGNCDAFSTDISQLASWRSTLDAPSDHIILGEVISKEPLSPVVRHGDNQWKDLVTWVIYGLISAEEEGITQDNLEAMVANAASENKKRMLGVSGDLGAYLGLDNRWLYRAIAAVGNYEEIYERNVGKNTPLNISRRQNALWSNDGLLYSPPMR